MTQLGMPVSVKITWQNYEKEHFVPRVNNSTKLFFGEFLRYKQEVINVTPFLSDVGRILVHFHFE